VCVHVPLHSLFELGTGLAKRALILGCALRDDKPMAMRPGFRSGPDDDSSGSGVMCPL